MDPTSMFDRAADEIKAGQGSGPETVIIGGEKPKRQRKKKDDAPSPIAPQVGASEPVGAGVHIPHEQIEAALGPFLKSMAKLTKTSGPEREEVSGMATNLSFGLSHSKFGGGATSGPWTPLLIGMSLYVIPRTIEWVMNKADEMERKREEARRTGGTFPRLANAVAPSEATKDPAPQASSAGPTEFTGSVAAE